MRSVTNSAQKFVDFHQIQSWNWLTLQLALRCFQNCICRFAWKFTIFFKSTWPDWYQLKFPRFSMLTEQIWVCLFQLCPTRGPVEGCVQPSLGIRCSISNVHSDNLSLCRWSSGPLYHVCTECWEVSICPLTRWCKRFYKFSGFFPCSIGTKLA